VSRPRKPYGNAPGRLPATMLKVLAAELSDAGRIGRGKQYWADDAVVDLVVGHGVVTAEIQGSRPQPYVVTIETEPGAGPPSKRDVWVQCTCPDDDGTGVQACKHVVAALFALSDEVSIEPELLERWRGGRRRPARDVLAPEPAEPVEPAQNDASARPSVRPLHSVPSRDPEPAPRPPDPSTAQIGALLRAPAGAGAPTFPDVVRLDHGHPQGQWADVLLDALAGLEIRWE